MTNLKIEGDDTLISETQLKYIVKVLEERGFKANKVLIEAVGKKGDNYVANVKRIIVETDDDEPFTMIAKVAPTIEAVRVNMNIALVFQNEHVMYTEVLPRLCALQKDVDVPKGERFRYPICYGSLTEGPNEIILLEDLKKHDFVILDRFQSLTNESVKLAVEQLAILHSLSYVLKYKHPEEYEAFKSKLVNVWAIMETFEENKLYFNEMEKDVVSVLDNKDYVKIVQSTISQLPTNIGKMHKIDMVSKHSVIWQGDCWTNNMMFQLKENVPRDVILIDYQISKVGNPSSDLLYLIFNCTDYKTRSQYYYKWIDHYHSALEDSLANYGMKANYVYPRDQLDVDLKRHGKICLGLSCMLAYILSRESEDTLNFSNNSEFMKDMENTMDAMSLKNVNEKTLQRFRTRVEESIKSLVDFGYIHI